jgi:hypothetical protein
MKTIPVAHQEVLAVIPARGGSKSLPRKNVLPLGGKPLIAWSIEAALDSGLVTRVVVSTDDREIAEAAEEYGAEVPFLRPAELAGDRVMVNKAVRYTCDRLKKEQGYDPAVAVILYPTHPFRPPGLIDELTAKCIEGYSPVYPVKRIPSHEQAYVQGAANGWRFVGGAPGEVFRPYGIFEGVRLKAPIIGGYCREISDPVTLIDIDEAADLRLAEKVLDRGLYAPGKEAA